MRRAAAFILGLIRMFLGLILYWATLLIFGVKPAIAVALAFIVVDGARRLWLRQPFPPTWLIANGAAVLFGLIDLYARTPFMIRYEGAILNLGWAAAFALGAFGKEPLVLQFARQRAPDIPDRAEVVRFFRAFTFGWSLFFILRALAFLWIMARYPLAQAIAIRTAFSWASMGAMLLISINGRRLFELCQHFGCFIPAQDTPR